MSSFDTVTNIASIGVFLLTAVLFLLFSMQNKTRQEAGRALHSIPALERLRRAVFAAVENGTRVHLTLGKASIIHSNAASTLVGLGAIDSLVKITSYCDRPPLVTSGESTLSILARSTLRATYKAVNLPEIYDPFRSRLTGLTPFAYSAGLLPPVYDERTSAHIFCGSFGVEAALPLDMILRNDAYVLAASDSLPAQAMMFAETPDTLVGEELFAIPAYLRPERFQVSSLLTQDTLRWLIIIFLIIGAILKFSGVTLL